MRNYVATICCAALMLSAAFAQEKKNVPPPPKPVDDGPSLEATMKFIREKMAAAIKLESPGSKDVIAADPTKCEFTWTQRGGSWYGPTFIPSVRKTTFSFRDVTKIDVAPKRIWQVDSAGQSSLAWGAIPDLLVTTTPQSVHVQSLEFSQSLKDAAHDSDQESLKEENGQFKDSEEQELRFPFSKDADMPDRVARAMVHAVELCGGGSKPEPF
jgi:hypothetical protein